MFERDEKSKDVAFFSKEQRFKDNISDLPGPGEYQNDNPKFLVKNSSRKKNKRKKIFDRRKISNVINNEKSPKSHYRQISIPSKNLCYGFEVNEVGNLYVKDDPDKEMRYGGDKSDCVGPGSYEFNANERRLHFEYCH